MSDGASPRPAIPLVDIREGGPLRHAREREAQARALRDECLRFFPAPVRGLLPALDRLARHWLTRSASPYVGEVAAIAAALKISGVWFLNGSYQWGCTTLARDEAGSPWLARSLDWPFPGLGRHAEIARMQGPAGAFFSVTWPAYVGALTAMAPGRFGIAINQAPMWRRTRHRWLRPCDLMANAAHTFLRVRHIPPDQLLRRVMETAADFAEARASLEATPVARPVIFTLVGCRPGEACVIERTEEGFSTRCEETSTANDWLAARPRWEGRIASQVFLAWTAEQATENSRQRRAALAAFDGALGDEAFAWLRPPVLNPCTRLAVVLSPARGILRAMGLEVPAPGALPEPVSGPTEVRD